MALALEIKGSMKFYVSVYCPEQLEWQEIRKSLDVHRNTGDATRQESEGDRYLSVMILL